MISIVIPNYNGKHLLGDCLESLAEQTYNEYECIIVDNGSTDGSREYIQHNFPGTIIIELDKNYGFSYAVNRGIEYAKGEYIALLNNDTQVDKEWLYYLYHHILQDDNIFSVGSKMLKVQDPNIIDDAGEEYNALGWAYQIGAGKHTNKYDTPYEVFSNCGGAVLYRKQVLDKIGLLDENFFAYMEDIDIGYRAKLYGYKNTYEPRAEVLHIGSATSGGKYNEFKARLVARNNIWVPYKNMPTAQLILNSPFLIIGFLIKTLFFAKKGLSKPYIEGLKEGIQRRKSIEKIELPKKSISTYIYIEWLLIKNIFKWIIEKIK